MAVTKEPPLSREGAMDSNRKCTLSTHLRPKNPLFPVLTAPFSDIPMPPFHYTRSMVRCS